MAPNGCQHVNAYGCGYRPDCGNSATRLGAVTVRSSARLDLFLLSPPQKLVGFVIILWSWSFGLPCVVIADTPLRLALATGNPVDPERGDRRQGSGRPSMPRAGDGLQWIRRRDSSGGVRGMTALAPLILQHHCPATLPSAALRAGRPRALRIVAVGTQSRSDSHDPPPQPLEPFLEGALLGPVALGDRIGEG
jgi:hypothetical protein